MLVKVSDAARVLGISSRTIERALAKGLLRDYRQRSAPLSESAARRSGPKFYLVDLSETRAFLERRGLLTHTPIPDSPEAIIQGLLADLAQRDEELERYRKMMASTRRDVLHHAAPVAVQGADAAPPPTTRPRPPLPATPPPSAYGPLAAITTTAPDALHLTHRFPPRRQHLLSLTLTFTNGVMAAQSMRKLGNAHGMRGETVRAWAKKMSDAERASRRVVLLYIQQRLARANLPPMFRCIDQTCDCYTLDGLWRDRSDDEATLAMLFAVKPESERAATLKQMTTPAGLSALAQADASDEDAAAAGAPDVLDDEHGWS
jgi:hypothetical protein